MEITPEEFTGWLVIQIPYLDNENIEIYSASVFDYVLIGLETSVGNFVLRVEAP